MANDATNGDSFGDVLKGELEEIEHRRQTRVAVGEDEDGDWVKWGLPPKADPTSSGVKEPKLVNARLDDLRSDPSSPTEAITIESCDYHPGLAGLCLSGGGIRSASFCLGALQALHRWGLFERFDYLSTVSGGGFIGATLSSLYADGSTEFPFKHKRGATEGEVFRHLRDHSNYLLRKGVLDVLQAPALIFRGVIANFIAVLPYLLLLSSAMIWIFYDTVAAASLSEDHSSIWTDSFFMTQMLLVLLVVVLILYSPARALMPRERFESWLSRDRGSRFLALLVGLVALSALIEAYPITLYYYKLAWIELENDDLSIDLDMVLGLATALASFAAFFSASMQGTTDRLSSRLVLYGIGLLGPLLLYWIVLALGRWGLCGLPDWAGFLSSIPILQDWIKIESVLEINLSRDCAKPLLTLDQSHDISKLFALLAIILLAVLWPFINVNRTSLHGYYRDRLSKAFLLRRGPDSGAVDTAVRHHDDLALEELGGIRRSRRGLIERNVINPTLELLGKIDFLKEHLQPLKAEKKDQMSTAPYHLINAAVNIQRLKGESPNLRGRKADFFLFSQKYIGSRVTGYCKTQTLTNLDPHVDLGTAVAISGAAAAPNMGTSTIRPLVFILTMLNIRLGYWLPNPNRINLVSRMAGARRGLWTVLSPWRRVGPWYLL